MTYNGWTNYETWAVHLWLSDDEATYNHCRALARECRDQAASCPHVLDGIWTLGEAPKYLLANLLKDFVEDASPLSDKPSLYSDLLNAALSEVDWQEVADAFLQS